MRLAIACHEMYEDLALHIKEELVKVFTADDWGKYSKDGYSYTPQALVDPDGLECFDEFKFIISEEDIFEMYIKGGPTGDNHISVWSKEKVGRIPTVEEIMDYFVRLAEFEEGLHIRRRVAVEGADIRDYKDPGVEHLI